MRKMILIMVLSMSLLFLSQNTFCAFEINGDGTVTDTETGLMWQQATAGSMNWDAALNYCESLTLAGYDDWRLPNRNELQSIVDYLSYNPAIDTTAFPDSMLSYYWSSTSFAQYSSYAWRVYFVYGSVDYGNKTSAYYVRAVRGGQYGSFGDLVIWVTDAGSGYPIADADVAIEDTNQVAGPVSGVTDPNGRLEFPGIPFDEYLIVIDKPGYLSHTDIINIDHPGVLEIHYSLIPCDIYYRDLDQDGYGQENDSMCLVAPDAGNSYTALVSGDCNDYNWNTHPGAPDVCNGEDDDCDGSTDEDYIPMPTTCGQGACASTGELVCQDGHETNTCIPGEPAATDDNCDNIDDDCDGSADEDYIPRPTTCGVGACASTGEFLCQEGQEINTCMPGQPAVTDDNCDNIDDDCDGSADEDYIPKATTCGQGICASTGELVCQDGHEIDTCKSGEPAATDDNCDNFDDDCDGSTDEDYIPTPTTCGQGACTSTGELVCQDGHEINTCIPGKPAATDNNCDNIDDDCDGSADEDYIPTPTTCGQGICASTGQFICQGGQETDTCIPGEPAVDGETCNGLDDDCDGIVPDDETDADNDDWMLCEGDCNDSDASIHPGATEQCDGIDNNCNGDIDEACPAGTLTGRVLNLSTGRPLFNARIIITDGSSGSTNANGEYSISGITPGPQEIRFQKRGYYPTILKKVFFTADRMLVIDVGMQRRPQ